MPNNLFKTAHSGGFRVQVLRQNQLEKSRGETISRRDDEGVVLTTSRRSNEEIGRLSTSQRAGEFVQSSVLLVAHVSQDTHRSSCLEYCTNSLRSIDTGAKLGLLVIHTCGQVLGLRKGLT